MQPLQKSFKYEHNFGRDVLGMSLPKYYNGTFQEVLVVFGQFIRVLRTLYPGNAE